MSVSKEKILIYNLLIRFMVYLLGIQEYVEAVSFQHYIRHRSLISLEEINARLVFMRTEKADPKVPYCTVMFWISCIIGMTLI